MLKNQKDKFDLPNDVSYLNCANIAPLMNKLSILGKEAIDLRQRPYKISRDDWFKPPEILKRNFAKLINCDDFQRIALIPSVSYGIASVANNIKLSKKDEILIVHEQYPSNYYSWQNITKKFGAEIKIIMPPNEPENRGKLWNEKILNSISDKTRVVALGNVHWADGTLFQLEKISKKAKQHNALLIIDGSQSIGALPFDIQNIKPDAVFCVGYKWLLGPFSLGLSYFGEYFDNGNPLEENWINRKDSNDFQGLVDYTPHYRPLAGRYNVGENSNFHLVPILNGAIEQLNEWKVENVQAYCKNLIAKPIDELKNIGCIIEDGDFRANHLFGIRFGYSMDLEKLQSQFVNNKIFASLRGNAVRVSVNVYNNENDMNKLVSCIKNTLKASA
ncbi:aminotransferase class V-fold PLP-dependent enzyme [Xanthovirga aplysinae]|uniref:aminotransferase class V-fold PLP-dependent enzyme n=1 Tax=Xanthovirga aplysinae TaxID=2529853 RepID=UPI0012BC2067|nr:aminotransferase class V-fold PLP-dependent enzyme [Xanthovirga aplysinae]MTI30824.1 aminotransferase class V-fold PLP-dependent enzyme [Xanthovirga aplysinae]